MNTPLKFLFMMFLPGLFVVTLGDINHVYTGTTWYADWSYIITPVVNIPFWVPLQFGLASSFFALLYLLMRKKLNFQKSANLKNFVIYSVLFQGGYLISGWVGPQFGLYKDIGFFIVMLLGAIPIFGFKANWSQLFFILIVVAIGTCWEMNLVRLGVFGYHTPQNIFFGVPMWLMAIYFYSAQAVMEMVEFYENKHGKIKIQFLGL